MHEEQDQIKTEPGARANNLVQVAQKPHWVSSSAASLRQLADHLERQGEACVYRKPTQRQPVSKTARKLNVARIYWQLHLGG